MNAFYSNKRFVLLYFVKPVEIGKFFSTMNSSISKKEYFLIDSISEEFY